MAITTRLLLFCFKLAAQIHFTLKYLAFYLEKIELKSLTFSSKSYYVLVESVS